MSPVDIQATGVGQYFVELTIVADPRPFGFAFDFEPSGIQEGVFVFIIPQGIGSRKARAVTN
jgi:hypothetical protein